MEEFPVCSSWDCISCIDIFTLNQSPLLTEGITFGFSSCAGEGDGFVTALVSHVSKVMAQRVLCHQQPRDGLLQGLKSCCFWHPLPQRDPRQLEGRSV